MTLKFNCMTLSLQLRDTIPVSYVPGVFLEIKLPNQPLKLTSTIFEMPFSNLSFIIVHEEKTKEITNEKDVWICDPNYYHKIWCIFALNFSKKY